MMEGGADPLSQADRMREITRRALHAGAPAQAPAKGSKNRHGGIALAALGTLLVLIVAWFVLKPVASPLAGIRSADAADEDGLLATPDDAVHLFRLRPAPTVAVLTFPSLTAQARALNRIGAFVEKAGAPHDRVLSDTEMASLIQQDRETAENFYYGHDYRMEDVHRFFAAAARQGLPLHPEEAALRAMLNREAAAHPAPGALISLPPISAAEQIDPAARATILRHEISHGVYFTDAAYAAYTRHFWSSTLTEDQRAHFRTMLAIQGYDVTNEDLVGNETQAYLVHTPDPRYFSAAAVGMPNEDVARLRLAFVACMSPSWLRARTSGSSAECRHE